MLVYLYHQQLLYLLNNLSLQKLKCFNEDIANTARGEEEMSGDDSKLLTKIRKEFQAWHNILDQIVMKGKYQRIDVRNSAMIINCCFH